MRSGHDITPARIGGFRVIRRLATGGTSDVLLARAEGPHGFERIVVLKLLLPHLQEDASCERMFAREAAAYARLSHPAIVKLFDFFASDAQLVMVLEYVDGFPLHSLRALLRKAGTDLDDQAAFFLGSRIFSALGAAHGARDPESGEFAPVIHRDVNPSNVLIPWDGHAKLADFGIAKVAGLQSDTMAGLIKGTYGYMAPEQVRGEPITVRADVYAASLILWELLARRKAIHRGGLSDMEMLRAMAEPQLPSLDALRPDLPREVREALALGLAPAPDARTLSADDMLNVLRNVASLEEGRKSLVRAMTKVRPVRSDDPLARTQSMPTLDAEEAWEAVTLVGEHSDVQETASTAASSNTAPSTRTQVGIPAPAPPLSPAAASDARGLPSDTNPSGVPSAIRSPVPRPPRPTGAAGAAASSASGSPTATASSAPAPSSAASDVGKQTLFGGFSVLPSPVPVVPRPGPRATAAPPLATMSFATPKPPPPDTVAVPVAAPKAAPVPSARGAAGANGASNAPRGETPGSAPPAFSPALAAADTEPGKPAAPARSSPAFSTPPLLTGAGDTDPSSPPTLSRPYGTDDTDPATEQASPAPAPLGAERARFGGDPPALHGAPRPFSPAPGPQFSPPPPLGLMGENAGPGVGREAFGESAAPFSSAASAPNGGMFAASGPPAFAGGMQGGGGPSADFLRAPALSPAHSPALPPAPRIPSSFLPVSSYESTRPGMPSSSASTFRPPRGRAHAILAAFAGAAVVFVVLAGGLALWNRRVKARADAALHSGSPPVAADAVPGTPPSSAAPAAMADAPSPPPSEVLVPQPAPSAATPEAPAPTAPSAPAAHAENAAAADPPTPERAAGSVADGRVAATPPSSPSSPSAQGIVDTAKAPRGHRIFVDGRVVGTTPGAVSVACGRRTVRIGSGGKPQTVDVPCGGTITVKK